MVDISSWVPAHFFRGGGGGGESRAQDTLSTSLTLNVIGTFKEMVRRLSLQPIVLVPFAHRL
jgi:hypothetical protein